MKIAVFGSHEGVSRDVIQDYLETRFDPGVTLISGGARGVDSFAEQAWSFLGGNVISLRPVKLEDGESWAVERWETENSFVYIPPGEPEWADFKSAAFYRNLLIASEADRGVAFRHGRSGGTSNTIDIFETFKKPCVVHDI